MVKILGHSQDIFIDVADVTETQSVDIFPNINKLSVVEFSGKYKREDDEIYYINLSEDYEIIEDYVNIFDNMVSLSPLNREIFSSIDCILIKRDNKILFQKIYNRNVLKHPYFYFDGRICNYEENKNIVTITSNTDILYDIDEKRLYFYDFSKAKSILKKIEKFYREATDGEIADFFNNDILSLKENTELGTQSRIRIALMAKDAIFDNKNEDDVKKWANYAKKYGKPFPSDNNKVIEITNNKDIGFLYDSVYENYYTTDLTKQKRKTNSSKPI